MKLSLLLIMFSLSLLLVGCVSSTQNKSTDTSAEGDTTAEGETMPPPPPALAPSNARVSAVVRSYQDADNAYVCTLEIQEVQRYGAGTPPLPVGSEVEVFMRKILFGDDPDGTIAAERLQTGQTIDVTLRHQQAPEGSPSAPSWEAVQIH